MLTRRKAALLKNDGDLDSVPQKENEVPITSPGSLSRTVGHKSNKTPRAHSRGDADIERPSKRRRESPALETAAPTVFNKPPSDSEERDPSPTPIVATPREASDTLDAPEGRRIWVQVLRFSLIFTILYALFWVLLLQVANVTLSEDELTAPSDESVASADTKVSSLHLNTFCPSNSLLYGPFMPFTILNSEEAAHLDLTQVLMQCPSRVTVGEEAVAAFVIATDSEDCQETLQRHSELLPMIENRACLIADTASPRLVWEETLDSSSCHRSDESYGLGADDHVECDYDV